MRNSRLALAFNGVIMVLLGIVFWFFPELFTVAMFPNISENEQAINVGIALRKNMGVGCVFIGMLFSRSNVQKRLHNVSYFAVHLVSV